MTKIPTFTPSQISPYRELEKLCSTCGPLRDPHANETVRLVDLFCRLMLPISYTSSDQPPCHIYISSLMIDPIQSEYLRMVLAPENTKRGVKGLAILTHLVRIGLGRYSDYRENMTCTIYLLAALCYIGNTGPIRFIPTSIHSQILSNIPQYGEGFITRCEQASHHLHPVIWKLFELPYDDEMSDVIMSCFRPVLVKMIQMRLIVSLQKTSSDLPTLKLLTLHLIEMYKDMKELTHGETPTT